MKRFSLLALLTVIASLVAVTPAAAQIIVPPPCGPTEDCIIQPGVFTDPDWLKVTYHRVTVDISNQIATTNVDMEFVNEGNGLAEGTFLFPLPQGAAVDQLIMYIDGQAIESKILEAEEARGIYNEIVRQYRDPALLEYVGTGAIQANVFPIPPGDSRRIEIGYSQVLEVDNGLVQYIYPMNSTSSRPVEEMSVSVNVESPDPISNVYSPSNDIAIVRQDDDMGFRAGFEQSNFVSDGDFSLFYGVASDTVNVNLLTYKESAAEDGFFMLLVQPPVEVPEEQVIPRDIIIVLDQSGSMDGDKWDQARDAATYVLDNLNAQDRFNVITFSTGWRMFSMQMEPIENADEAVGWIRNMDAIGGTDINAALTEALNLVGERPATILFLTDGLATEGIVETSEILDNVEAAAPNNVSIFTFGVGDDVDTFLLDTIVQDFNGVSSYVRPTERIDEEVASLYSKISAPVLTDVEIDFGGVRTNLLFPQEAPDLFAGEQLTLVGRYRDDAEGITLRLTGKVNGDLQTYIYEDLEFRARAGGEPFIARLWATRRIGDLLNSIRLNGENPELVDSVVTLSVRYGIITPYTSFLIEEDDILSQQGRDRAVEGFREEAQVLSSEASGRAAVTAADDIAGFSAANAPAPAAVMPTQSAQAQLGAEVDADGLFFADEEEALMEPVSPGEAGIGGGAEFDGNEVGAGDTRRTDNPVQTVNDKTFILQGEVWTDTTFEPDTMQTTEIVFLSDEYFALLDERPEFADYLALGEQVIVVVDGTAYEVVPDA